MALNELGESLMFLVPKPILTGTQTYRPEEVLVQHKVVASGTESSVPCIIFSTVVKQNKQISATVSPVLSAIILFLAGREAFQSNSVVLSQF